MNLLNNFNINALTIKSTSLGWRNTLLYLLFAIVVFVRPTQAQQVDARLSPKKAYVTQPILFDIRINNARDYELPETFKIPGCTIESAGEVQESSQIFVINGKRSVNRSVTARFIITPNRAGEFRTPELKIKVNGRVTTIEPAEFSAQVSETGDLLFVEIEPAKEQVFVGEPLGLQLKIWLKAFSDEELKIRLTEGNMWRMISSRSSWGEFKSALIDLDKDGERPAGEVVFRKDKTGRAISSDPYFLFEVDTTIYPTLPGKLEIPDVNIVVNYPVSLGRTRSAFDSFFGRSLGGDRVVVKQSRPISAAATVAAAEVLPIPTAGRPSDYRGAVGNYAFGAIATPDQVAAGDPIILQMIVDGDGPMELVQAPPLGLIESLTDDFKVSDQPLAGLVRDTRKFFQTTIRPRREGITAIPPIPFSFFDPDKKEFITIYSEPISIKVTAAESLSLDSIAGGGNDSGLSSEELGIASKSGLPSLQNVTEIDFSSHANRDGSSWWLQAVLVAPPVMWSIVAMAKLIPWIGRKLQRPKTVAINQVSSCTTATELADVVSRFILAKAKATPTDGAVNHQSTAARAIGSLRNLGLPALANETESWLNGLVAPANLLSRDGRQLGMSEQRQDAVERIGRLDAEISRIQKQPIIKTTVTAAVLLMTAFFSSTAACAQASNPSPSVEQLKAVFAEANEAYQKGIQRQTATSSQPADKAESQVQFAIAVKKYQWLLDQAIVRDIPNAALCFNLGNAYLQTRQYGRAIANYQRAIAIAPSWRKADDHLRFAYKKIDSKSKRKTNDRQSLNPNRQTTSAKLLDFVLRAVHPRWYWFAIGLGSILFWGLLIAKTVRPRLPTLAISLIPLFVMATACGALWATAKPQPATGILVADPATDNSGSIEIRSGDGLEFPVVDSLVQADGNTIGLLDYRQGWFQIETESGRTGWVMAKMVEPISWDWLRKQSAEELFANP